MDGTMISTVEDSNTKEPLTIDISKCGTVSDINTFNTCSNGSIEGVVDEFGETQMIKSLLLAVSSKVTAIENQLNILQVNRGLEKEWSELAQIKAQYEKKEKEILEKIAIMKNLKEGHTL